MPSRLNIYFLLFEPFSTHSTFIMKSVKLEQASNTWESWVKIIRRYNFPNLIRFQSLRKQIVKISNYLIFNLIILWINLGNKSESFFFMKRRIIDNFGLILLKTLTTIILNGNTFTSKSKIPTKFEVTYNSSIYALNEFRNAVLCYETNSSFFIFTNLNY